MLSTVKDGDINKTVHLPKVSYSRAVLFTVASVSRVWGGASDAVP